MSKKATLQLSKAPLFKSLPAEESAHILQSHKSWDTPLGSLVLEEGLCFDDVTLLAMKRMP